MIKVTQLKVKLGPVRDLALRAESLSKLGANHRSKGRLIKSITIQEILLNHCPSLVKINNYLFRVLRGVAGRGTLNLLINLACLSVCLYPKNVKTAEPIGSKFLWDHA